MQYAIDWLPIRQRGRNRQTEFVLETRTNQHWGTKLNYRVSAAGQGLGNSPTWLNAQR
jgi:hypothetical protein